MSRSQSSIFPTPRLPLKPRNTISRPDFSAIPKPGGAFEHPVNVPTVQRAVDSSAVGRIRMMQETGAERIAGPRGGGRVREAQPDR